MKIADFDTKKAPFIIAELSANHGKDLKLAEESIYMAKKAGANAVKIQTYDANSLTLKSNRKEFKIKDGLWEGKKLYTLYQEACTPYEWHERLFNTAKKAGILLFSTPFSLKDLDFLRPFDPPLYKISSFEFIDFELVRALAKEQKPVLASTGIADQSDIKRVVDIFKEEKNPNLALLQCCSSYPTRYDEVNLKSIKKLSKYGCELGLSDHSPGFLAPVLGLAFGANIIEKHFALNKFIKSPDLSFSLDCKEFAQMCEMVRLAFIVLGDGKPDKKNKSYARSLFANKAIKKGSLITPGQIACVRPFKGLHPKYKDQLIGSIAKRNIPFSAPFKEDDL